MAKDGTIKINTELDSSKAQSAMQKFSSTAQNALKGIAVAVGTVGTAMTAMAGYAVKVGSDFEAGMSKVSAISGATGSDLEALTDKAKEMGAKTKFSATEAASAFEYMAMAGWKTEDMLNGIEGIMNLAAASGEDLAATSDIVTDALTAFGLSASDSSHFADVLASASSNANTNVSMMGETFKYVAPVAGALGFSAEDTAVAIGLMANSGIKAGQAGTALRAMMSRLAKPTDEVAATMDRLGISLTNSDGSMKSLNEVMLDLRSGFSGLSEAEKASAAASLAGQEAMSGMLAIVSASDTDFEKLKSSIYSCDGATEKMAETMQDNLQGSLTIMKSAIEGFGIKIYEEMQEPLREAADIGTEYINRLSDAFTSGGLQGVVDEAGEIFNDFVDRIADTGETAEGVITPIKNVANAAMDLGNTAVPPALKAMEMLAKNMDKVASVAVSAYTAFKTYGSVVKTVTTAQKANAAATALLNKMEKANALQLVATNGGLTIRQTLMGVYTGQISVATAATGLWTKAQTGLNATLSANPIGLVVTAIAALAAGTAAYAIVTKDAAEKAYGLNSEQKKSVEACEEAAEKLNEQRTAREESIQSIDREYDGYEALLGELQSITDANGNVKAGYEDRAKVITGLLSDALGIEIEMLDGQIQKYDEVVQAIDEVIIKKKAEAVLSSMQDDMANAYANTSEAIDKYKETAKAAADKTTELEAAQKEADAARQRYDNSMGMSAEVVQNLAEESAKADEKVRILTEAQKEAADAAQESKNEMEALSAELENYNALNEAVASGDVAKIEEALNNLVTSYRAYTGEALAASEETRKAMYDQANGYIEDLGLIQDGTIQVADEIYAQMADAAAKTIQNFNQLPGGIARGIEDIGPEASAAMIAALAQADLDGKLDEEGKAALDSFITALDGMDEDTQEIMSGAVEGAMKGLEGFDQIQDKAREGSTSFLQALRDTLKINSPSKEVMEIFKGVWEGASKGLDEGDEELNTKGIEVCNSFLDTLRNSGIGEAMQSLGSDIMSFFGIGISSQQENSRLAGQANADAANAGAGSVNPTVTGSTFGGLFGGGIGGMISYLFGQGKALADNAQSGASSVNPTGTGGSFGSQYASGVGGKTGEANSKGRALADNAQSGASSADGYTPGSDFGSGFVQGIGSWLGEAASAAANLAVSAYQALRNALEEKSPSKKTKRSGKYFTQGLGIGIKDNEDYAVSAATELAENTLDALDVDALYEKIKEIDIPETMARIYAAIDDKHSQVADRVTAAAIAKEKNSYMETRPASQAAPIDYRRIGIETARAIAGMSVNIDGERAGEILTPRIDTNIGNITGKKGRYMK